MLLLFLASLCKAVLIVGALIAFYSHAELLLHKYIMHRPFYGFKYPFKKHHQIHHGIFGADESYHLHNEADRKTIPMAWWNGPVILTLAMTVPGTVAFCLRNMSILWAAIPVGIWYFAMYEYMHWCMHLPNPRPRYIERSWIFFKLNGHHLLHHQYKFRNFNVVLPFADWLWGTLITEAPKEFKQATGLRVPNVQPRPNAKPRDKGRKRVFLDLSGV